MTQRDMAGFWGIDVKTIRNWRKTKPNLYKTLMKGLAFDEIVESQKMSYDRAKELQEKYEKLDR